jgi:ribosome maturation factor RimP
MGYELVGAEYGGGRLRVYIDCPEGVTLDDCAAVSDELSLALDVADPIAEAYHLEVSSPGVNRPLFEPHDFERFTGERVLVRLCEALDGRKRFKGKLVGMEAEAVVVEVDGQTRRLPIDRIMQAHVVAEM